MPLTLCKSLSSAAGAPATPAIGYPIPLTFSKSLSSAAGALATPAKGVLVSLHALQKQLTVSRTLQVRPCKLALAVLARETARFVICFCKSLIVGVPQQNVWIIKGLKGLRKLFVKRAALHAMDGTPEPAWMHLRRP